MINPLHHIFLEANAGSGKTKNLIDRLLRLLLIGVMPHQILCLTFTKAAAGEMANRLHRILLEWSLMEEVALSLAIKALEGEVTHSKIGFARTLFRRVLDAPGGLRLLTIHSFAESLLKRFPLEAGVAPDFQTLEEAESKHLLFQAVKVVLRNASTNPEMQKSLSILTSNLNVEDLISLTEQLASAEKEDRLFPLISIKLDHVMEDMINRLEMQNFDSIEKINQDFDHKMDKKRAAILKIIDIYPKIAETVQHYMGSLTKEKGSSREAFISCFLTKKNTPVVNLEKKIIKTSPELVFEYTAIMAIIEAFLDCKKRLLALEISQALLSFAPLIWRQYELNKEHKGALDFNDLVRLAAKLLEDTDHAWVHFKLDKGLNHILVDEAQDTNPAQWRIIHALSEPFFQQGAKLGKERTLFVVGDVKQSIYSFQGVKPDQFQKSEMKIEELSRLAEQRFENIPLTNSYRSLPNILKTVDVVLAEKTQSLGLRANKKMTHSTKRMDADTQGGRVTIWPPFLINHQRVSDAEIEAEPWFKLQSEPNDNAQENFPPPSKSLAIAIANWIKKRISEGSINNSRGKKSRKLHAGDFMILLRSRSSLMTLITKQLIENNIPVAGADRMKVLGQLAVKDMIALLSWLLDPEDDLLLAVILKGPFCNLSEEQLFALAYQRDKNSLFQRVKTFASEEKLIEGEEKLIEGEANPTTKLFHKSFQGELSQILDWLFHWLGKVDYDPAYELMREILNQPIPARQGLAKINGKQALMARMGQEIDDPIEELLTLSLQYEANNPPSLQGLLGWLKQGSTEIKREMEEIAQEVRIMTIHGAKGLQAPIVIIPEEIDRKKPNKKIIDWLATPLAQPKSNFPASPIFIAKKDNMPKAIKTLREQAKAEEDNESLRLFYVAMTRAEDEILLCGHGKYNKDMKSFNDFLTTNADKSWLKLTMNSLLKEMHNPESTMKINLAPAPAPDAVMASDAALVGDSIIIGEAVQQIYDQAIEGKTPKQQADLPNWLFNPAPAYEPLRQPLSPSRIDEDEPFIDSPLLTVQGSPSFDKKVSPYLKGRLIHSLLESLPELEPARRAEVALHFLKNRGSGIPALVQEKMVNEVLEILNHLQFSSLFGSNSRAEVMVKGQIQIGGKAVVISGQIDRLVIGDQEILILDYKSGREVPMNMAQVPIPYLKQLRLYRDLMQNQYPNHSISTALLWTDHPSLMPIPDQALNNLKLV